MVMARIWSGARPDGRKAISFQVVRVAISRRWALVPAKAGRRGGGLARELSLPLSPRIIT
jgi:hypothetical protein